MKVGHLNICMLLIFSVFPGCGPMQETKYAGPDLSPPQLIGIKSLAEGELEIEFNEAVSMKKESVLIDPVLDISEIKGGSGESVVSMLTATQVVGQMYKLTAIAEDINNNSLSFTAVFYGFNPSIPSIVINEFITNGSSAHPDLVELKVLDRGNLGGLVIYEGTPGNYDECFVFPACLVMAGDFILVHFKPQSLACERNEITDKRLSEGLDSSPEAFDFWVPGGNGLSGNNGVISLWASLGGDLLDGVLYSNRTSYSDENYGGFGTNAVWQQAQEFAATKGWKTEESRVRPEDAVNPEGSTSTRSLCRCAGPDTDTKADWYIVPTRQSTFGSENSTEIYIPPSKGRTP